MAENYTQFFVPGTPKLEVLYSKTEKDYKGCILCVHGVCHGAWCFENFLTYFPENGYDCYALSLRGHAGSEGYKNLSKYGLSDYSDDIKNCIEFCKSDECDHQMRSKPFLLGHSMGGAVAQKYIGDYADTVNGVILFAPATAPKMDRGKTIRDIILEKNLQIAARKSFGFTISDEEMAVSAFFDNRVPLGKVKKYNARLQKESLKIILFHLFAPYSDHYNCNIPMLVIGSYKDSYFPEESLRDTANIYKCSEGDTKKQLKILPDLCHDMMLDETGWKESAKAVLKFMEDNK